MKRAPWYGAVFLICAGPLPTLQTEKGALHPVFAAESESGRRLQTILFFGDSITAGYGVPEKSSFPALIREKIARRGWRFRVINGGLNGETTAGGRRRIDWLLRNRVDLMVLELGGNDGLRGIPPDEVQRNLQAIIEKTRQKYPEVKLVLAGMEAPPNMGRSYTESFRAVFPAVAAANHAVLIPFVLKGVAGNPRLNLPDGIHPTAEGHRIVAANVWSVLEPILMALAGEPE